MVEEGIERMIDSGIELIEVCASLGGEGHTVLRTSCCFTIPQMSAHLSYRASPDNNESPGRADGKGWSQGRTRPTVRLMTPEAD